MRIISGCYKGRKLALPNQNITRPTSDKVRCAIFNILEHGLLPQGFADLTVLDAFAGSGALGLEALSRGAMTIDFVEKNRDVCQILVKNIKSLLDPHAQKHITVTCLDFTRYTLQKSYDLIFFDPPFQKTDLYIQGFVHLIASKVWHDKTIIYTESASCLTQIIAKNQLPLHIVHHKEWASLVTSFWKLTP